MTVFSGMLIATILGVLLIPALYMLVGKLTGSKPGHAAGADTVRRRRPWEEATDEHPTPLPPPGRRARPP